MCQNHFKLLTTIVRSPVTIELLGITPFTTVPAPIIQLSPIVVFLRIITPAPIHTLFPILTSPVLNPVVFPLTSKQWS